MSGEVPASSMHRDPLAIRGWLEVLSAEVYPSGDCEVVSALLNLSQVPECMFTPEIIAELRDRLRTAAWRRDPEIWYTVQAVRESMPASHWWWWPERI